eukprot:3940880-Rhodomonas_salina.2
MTRFEGLRGSEVRSLRRVSRLRGLGQAHELFIRMGLSQRLVDDFIRGQPLALANRHWVDVCAFAPAETVTAASIILHHNHNLHHHLLLLHLLLHDHQHHDHYHSRINGNRINNNINININTQAARCSISDTDAGTRALAGPTLLVGLFKPPEELSAAVAMELLYFYALAHQTSQPLISVAAAAAAAAVAVAVAVAVVVVVVVVAAVVVAVVVKAMSFDVRWIKKQTIQRWLVLAPAHHIRPCVRSHKYMLSNVVNIVVDLLLLC